MKRLHALPEGAGIISPTPAFRGILANLVTPATREHERLHFGARWKDRNLSHPGQAGEWIGAGAGAWYPAKPRKYVREAMGNIQRELVIIGETVHSPLPPFWAIY